MSNPLHLAYTFQQLEAAKKNHLVHAQQAEATKQYHLTQAAEMDHRIKVLTQQQYQISRADTYPHISPSSSLSSSQQMFQQPPTQTIYEDEKDIPNASAFQAPRPISQSVTEDQLSPTERQLIEQDKAQAPVVAPKEAQAPVEAPKKAQAPVAAPKKAQAPVEALKSKYPQPTYAQKAHESAPKPVTTEEPKSKYPAAKPNQSPKNEKDEENLGFMKLKNAYQIAKMFNHVLPMVHEAEVNKKANRLHTYEKNNREIVDSVNDTINFPATVKGVDLGREVDFNGDDTDLTEEDNELKERLENAMKKFYGDTMFYINRVWTIQYDESEYRILKIAIGVHLTREEKTQIMAKLNQLRRNETNPINFKN
jgi:hypothetical protein